MSRSFYFGKNYISLTLIMKMNSTTDVFPNHFRYFNQSDRSKHSGVFSKIAVRKCRQDPLKIVMKKLKPEHRWQAS